MNKKIVGITIAIIVVAVTAAGVKTILGDKATELPGEEQTEKTLNLQETKSTANSTESAESGSTESGESGP